MSSGYVVKFGADIVTAPTGEWVGYHPYIPPPPLTHTVTFEFSSTSYDPRTETYGWKTGAEWTQISASPNRWRYVRDDSNWAREFELDVSTTLRGFFDANQSGVTYKIIDGNLTGVTNIMDAFAGSKGVSPDDTIVEYFGCYNLTEVNLPELSTVVYGYHAFRDNPNLTTITLGDMPACTDASFMFINDSGLVNVTLGDMSAVTRTRSMFGHCGSLVTAPYLDTSHVIEAEDMFNYCLKLKNVPLYDFSSAKNVGGIFHGCAVLQSVPAFDFSSAVYMFSTFTGCEKLTAIPNFTLATVSPVPDFGFNVTNMFKNCYLVSSGITRIYNKMAAWTDTVTHTDTFADCGRDSVSGSAELANIPSDWK